MDKVFSLLLSALLLVQSVNVEMSDVLGFSDLVDHARFHTEKYGDTLLVFLSKHYGTLEQEHKKVHREEQQEHEELPFNHHACNHTVVPFVLFGKPLPPLRSGSVVDTRPNFFYQESSSSFEKFEIFQPPRLV
jgi:hypothetical protein